MAGLFTLRDRQDLNRAVMDYLASQSIDPAVLENLRHGLKTQESATTPSSNSHTNGSAASTLTLERKWKAVVLLQREILDLRTQLDQARAPDPAEGANRGLWLPRPPASSSLFGHRGAVTAVSFHPVWSSIATASEDGTIKIWDSETGDLERTIRAHTRSVADARFGGSLGPNSLLVSCSSDLTIKLWDPKNEYASIQTLLGHDHTVSSVCFVGPEDKYVASASRDRTIRIWQLETGYCIRIIKGHSDWVRALAPSADGLFVASVSNDSTARISATMGNTLLAGPEGLRAGPVSHRDHEPQLVFTGHEHVVECVAIAPESAWPYLANLEGLAPNSINSTNSTTTEQLPAVSVRYFATGSRDSTIIIWSMHQKQVARLLGHENWVRGLVFHPQGRFLLSVADDNTMRIWDLENGAKLVRTIQAHSHFVTSIAWGGKKTVATGCVDTTASIWR